MAKRKKIITVPSGSVEKICSALGCKKTMVYNALAYDSDTELAQKIRKEAISVYGGIYNTKIVF